jgi:uncharacterized protein HemX
MSPTAPRGLRWTEGGTVRAVANLVAFVALLGAVGIGFRQQAYVNCVADVQHANAVRTAVIAKATDTERALQRKLIAAHTAAEYVPLRDAVLAAYDETDRVRAANPPITRDCG